MRVTDRPALPRRSRPWLAAARCGVANKLLRRFNRAMTVPQAQQDRILRRYTLRRRRFPLRGGTLSLVAPRSMEDLLTGARLAHYERIGRLPYWADIWPASLALAQAIARGPDLTGLRVLDLGCGVGLAGTAAAWRGAAVTFVDCEPDALAFARFNAEQNRGQGVVTLRHDFERAPVPGTFDRILLADVAYERRLHAPILRQLTTSLQPGGTAWMADPYRTPADPLVDELAARFRCEQSELSVCAIDRTAEGRRIPMRLVAIGNPWPAPAQAGLRA